MSLDRTLLSAIPLEAVGKVIDIEWSKVFAFEEFPDCLHVNKKDEIDCVDCVCKLYDRERWLESYLSNIDKIEIKNLDGSIMGKVGTVKVVRGKYEDCIGVITEL
jgi:hypothetical protein